VWNFGGEAHLETLYPMSKFSIMNLESSGSETIFNTHKIPQDYNPGIAGHRDLKVVKYLAHSSK
jgi:hypothetical protein